MRKFWSRAIPVAAVMAVGAGSVLAQSGGGGGDDGNAITVPSVLDVSTLVTAVVTVGGAALVAALGVGGGFRIAKKAYVWMMQKI